MIMMDPGRSVKAFGSSLADTEENTIRQYGESGFVRYLATQDGLRIARPEPDPRAELRHLVERISPEKAGLFNGHMVAVLAEAVREGERAFAVVGRNHVPMQAPALRCALQ